MVSGSGENSSTAFRTTSRNSSYVIPGMYDLTVEDSNWVLTSSFIIFTMQTGKRVIEQDSDNLKIYVKKNETQGFGMLESGCVSIKNEVNIMMKNIVDIVLGGLVHLKRRINLPDL